MITKHTRERWGRNIAPVSRYPIIYAGRNTHVAQVVTRGLPEAEAEANADLIAAAPDLLAALARLVEAVRGGDETAGCSMDDALIDADEAIAKATGR